MASRGVNKVILVGNLGQDPEVRYTQNSVAIANFSVATSESWKDKQSGEQKEITEWHRVVCYRRLAEIAGEYLKKGSKVYIEGRLQTRKWQDQQGQDRYTTEIVCNEMQMLDSRGGQGGGGGYDQSQSQGQGGQSNQNWGGQQSSGQSGSQSGGQSSGQGSTQGNAPASNQGQRQAQPAPQPAPLDNDFDDDIPF